MPLPAEHISRLREQLNEHEERASFLREQLNLLQRELHAHELLLRLGRDHRVLSLLNRFYDDRDQVREASPNLVSYARAQGLTLPEDLRFLVRGGESVTVEAIYSDDVFGFRASWDSGKGFSSDRLHGRGG